MTYKGRIRNGTVVLEPGSDLPDGAEVEVALATDVTVPGQGTGTDERGRRLWQALRAMPEETSFEDVIEKVYLLYKIERGVRQLDAGEGVPHEEARRLFKEWLE